MAFWLQRYNFCLHFLFIVCVKNVKKSAGKERIKYFLQNKKSY